MDAFELLKNDHKKVSQLFKEIESAATGAKTQLFNRLKTELDLHAHIEETFLYPALENTEEAREITLEAYEEHKVVKDLLAELAGAATPDDEWDAKLTVLKENVEHHVEEEEGELFSKARKALSTEEIDRLGAQMEAEKARQQGGEKKRSQPARREAVRTESKRSPKEAENPGVLKRIANFVGLGDSSSGTSKSPGSKKPASKKAGTKSTGTKSTKSTTKSARKSASKAKPAGKAAGKSPRRVNASKTSVPARAQKRVASGTSRDSAKKNSRASRSSRRSARTATKRSKSK
jgi:hemerythrin superfamily protein